MKNNKTMNKLKRLNSECFLYENYESNWWSLLDIGYIDAMGIENIMNAVKNYAIGYCESDKIKLRPKGDSYAVMFEKDGERFWFHIRKRDFEEEN